MEPYKLGEMEQRFADLIWANAPIASGELVVLCAAELAWKNPPPTPCSSGCASGACLKTVRAG